MQPHPQCWQCLFERPFCTALTVAGDISNTVPQPAFLCQTNEAKHDSMYESERGGENARKKAKSC
eukprot:2237703-Amphidinium_carterae.1